MQNDDSRKMVKLFFIELIGFCGSWAELLTKGGVGTGYICYGVTSNWEIFRNLLYVTCAFFGSGSEIPG